MTNIRRLQDIQVGNESLLETYRNYFANRYVNEAHNLINTNTLKSYVLQAEWMNAVKIKIEDLEEHKDIEIDQKLNNANTEFQFNINELLYMQEYNNILQYYKNNFVLYNNKVYFCIQNSLGNLPTNTSYWLDVGLIGKKGQYGLGVNYCGLWNEETQYNKYDLIYYENNLYIAIEDNFGKTPNSNKTSKYLNNLLYLDDSFYLGEEKDDEFWFLLTNVEPQPIYVFPFDYTSLSIGSIFFKELPPSILSTFVSVSGNIVSTHDAIAGYIHALSVDITPVQDLHGYDNPWSAGGGKNLLPLTIANLKTQNTSGTWAGNTYTWRGITFAVATDDGGNVVSITVNGTLTSGQTSTNLRIAGTLDAGNYILTGCPSGGSGSGSYRMRLGKGSGSTNVGSDIGSGRNFTFDGTTNYDVKIYIETSSTVSNLVFYPMIRQSSVTDATFAPYSNICPISGHTEANIYRENNYNPTADPTLIINLDGTRYGSTLDVLTGEMIVTDSYIASYAGEALPSTWISDRDVYVAGTTPTTGAQVVYKLGTPLIVQLTPNTLAIWEGENTLWCNTGNIEITYKKSVNL